MLKKYVCLLMAVFLCFCTACGQSSDVSQEESFTPELTDAATNGVIKENNRFSFSWDSANHCVLLTEKETGYIWSTTPYEHYQSGEYSYSLNSPVVIDYYDPLDGSTQTIRSVDCVDRGLVGTRTQNDVLFVDYYFDDAQIFVSVSYALREEGLAVGLNTSDLAEYGKNKLISVSLAPYFCSSPNSDDKNNYLFIPSGSGALMYVDEEPGGAVRQFSGEVYGNDPAKTLLDQPGDETAVRLPVFGVKNQGHALVGIIEEGAGAAVVQAAAGNSRVGYSAAYATFYVRGVNNVEWDTGKVVSGAPVIKDVGLLTERWPQNCQYTVTYYPLSGEDADYVGMANVYQNYLLKNELLRESNKVQESYHLSLVGGAQSKEFTLGIPYQALQTLTTTEQAEGILREMRELTGVNAQVQLFGFGKSGVDSGIVAGGFSVANKLGGIKGLKQLESYCKDNNYSLFMDFDLIGFSTSGNGISPMFNAAMTADSQKVALYSLLPNTRVPDKNQKARYLVKRSSLGKLSEKLHAFANKNLSGISLSSFGKTAYSDYSEEAYMLKGQMVEQVQGIVLKMQQSGHPVLLSAANGFIAGLSDAVIDVPLFSGGYDALDVSVPFYELVYRGYVPLYTEPMNLAVNSEELLLSAVEAGVSPSFMLAKDNNASLAESVTIDFYGISYDGHKDMLADTVSELNDYLKAIGSSKIQSHEILQKELTKTIFDNGVHVIVNHSNEDITYNDTIVMAKSFQYGKS